MHDEWRKLSHISTRGNISFFSYFQVQNRAVSDVSHRVGEHLHARFDESRSVFGRRLSDRVDDDEDGGELQGGNCGYLDYLRGCLFSPGLFTWRNCAAKFPPLLLHVS